MNRVNFVQSSSAASPSSTTMAEKASPSPSSIPTTSSSSSSPSPSSPLIPRILSGSIGSLVTALAVTPLEVVKIRQQAAGAHQHHNHHHHASSSSTAMTFRGVRVEPCKGCGTLVFNGLTECVLPIHAQPTTTTPLRSTPQSISNSMASNKNMGTLSTLLSIFRNEGYSGLYAGLRPTLVMSVPNTVLYFTAYDEISVRLRRNHANYTTTITTAAVTNNRTSAAATAGVSSIEEDAKRQAYIPLLAGSSARLLASLATAPLELIRTRQASFGNSQNNHHNNNTRRRKIPTMMEEFRHLTKQNGLSSLYVGLTPTLWRDVPFSAIYWLFLEKFRLSLKESKELGTWGGVWYEERGQKIPRGLEGLHAFVSGAAAGSIAAAFTTPFDVVKTRRQMVTQAQDATCDHFGMKEYSQSHQNNNNNNKAANLGAFGHMRRIVDQEGISGLWKGNVTRMVKVAPACAIMISCYEFGKRVFGEVI